MASRPEPIPLHNHAIDNLRFIRATMERAGSFTAVPGTGGIAMGLSAFAAAMVAMAYPSFFLKIWLCEAAIALLIGVAAVVHKARGLRISLASGPSRKFILGFTPPLVAGAVLTLALVQANVPQLLPGVWLCMYGAAIIAGGAYSVRIVPFMGIGFFGAGIAALFRTGFGGNTVL